MVDWLGVGGLAVGIIGTGYGIWSDWRRRSDREWVHMSLANLKPGIRGDNRAEVVAAINNMMAFLKSPRGSARSRPVPSTQG